MMSTTSDLTASQAESLDQIRANGTTPTRVPARTASSLRERGVAVITTGSDPAGPGYCWMVPA
jgi:hypothetical protein